ncbi:PQQ-binding-like beta-propeller repeat protein [Streptomyces sp. NPDC004732]|uniref:outer membrane protein assembly factor BamB family protein n=1 Tax=Streptomyces sp. NPDC004732 TaxID=3154290 RepID=UPI0033A48F1D
MPQQHISRRSVLRAGGAVGLVTAAGLATAGPGQAAQPTGGGGGARVVDLGPAVVRFSLMSAVLVGDTLYIGSRNLDPVKIIALHMPTGKVVAQTPLGTGHSIQALAADPTGRYLYAGVLQKSVSRANLYRWDLKTPGKPAEALGRIGDRDIRDLTVAPDGAVFAVGSGGAGGAAPALWEYDPAKGGIVSLGVPSADATTAQAVAATASTVFFGAGSILHGGGGKSKAALFALDRAAREFSQVTPRELQRDASIRELAVIDDKLVVGTAGHSAPAQVAVMDLADLGEYSVAESRGTTAKKFAALDGSVYFAGESGLLAYERATDSIGPVEFRGPDLGEIWGVDRRGDKILVTSAFGFVAEIDPAAKTSKVIELADAGAPSAPQTVMGIAAGGGHVYVSGTGTIARHTLGRDGALDRDGTVYLRTPGEAKDAVVVDRVLYTGQYSSQGIWTHDPRKGDTTHQVAAFPPAQNRPADVVWDGVNRRVLVGVESDTAGGGSLWTYDPRTERSRCHVNPIDDGQCVRGLATKDGVAYLGGDNNTGTEPRATVVAFDPVAGKELWRVDPQQSAGVAALAIRGRHLYGLSRKGGFFVIDIRRHKLIHRADVSSVSNGYAAMVTNRGVVYGVSDTTVFRFHPKSFAVSTVVTDINGGWYSGSHITNDESGRLYTMRGRNLVQITDHPNT